MRGILGAGCAVPATGTTRTATTTRAMSPAAFTIPSHLGRRGVRTGRGEICTRRCHMRRHKHQWNALYSHPIPVVEAETDITCCEDARSAFLGDAQLSGLEQGREGLATSIDFDA